jgi:hypothetical protein
MPSNLQNTIFVSYAREDREWLERLHKHLRSFEREGKLSVWADPKIRPGEEWYEKICEAIAASSGAVLLVSPDFLDSDFIVETELPMLQEAAAEHGLMILWVALKPVSVPMMLKSLQCLNNPDVPISTLPSEAAQDQVFVRMCEEIVSALARRAAARRPRRKRRPRGAEGDLLDPPLRAFTVRPLEGGPCLMDPLGRLWVREGRQIKLFHVSQDTLLRRETLPDRPWKNHADATWQGHAVLSDWSGAIYRFDGQHHTREKPFHEARNDDLPVHRLAVGPQGHLFAAGWNGVVRRWEADGGLSTAGWPVLLPVLPLHLAPLGDGGLAVGDQDREIRACGPSGEEKWRWRADEPICRLWWTDEKGNPSVVGAQLGACRVLNLVDGRLAEKIDFSSPICVLARRPSRSGGSWGIVACEEGRIDWLSMTNLARLDGVDVDFRVRQLAVVPSLEDDARLIAVGLSEEGRLFTLDEVSLTGYEQPRGIRRFLVDPTGRFLYLLFERKIEVYVNPLARAIACRVDVAGPLQGKLKLNTSRKLAVRLRNTGSIPIHQVQAEFIASDSVQSHTAPRVSALPIQPGECIDLEFLVCARVAGDLPLHLRVTLLDEGGTATTWDKNLIAQSED